MKTPAKIPVWLAHTLLVVAAMCVVSVSGWYSPFLTAAGWHVFHPHGWVDYRGLHIRVPWPWTAEDTEAIDADPTVTPLGVALKKMPYEMIRRLPRQSIFVTVISPDRGVSAEEQTKRWMEMFRASHPGARFEAATGAIPAGASCLSASNDSSPEEVVWTCISVGGGWVANFEGQKGDEPVFFQVITDLKR